MTRGVPADALRLRRTRVLGAQAAWHVAPAFDVVALVGSGRPEAVAWSVRNYPDVPYLDTLAKAPALPALVAHVGAAETSSLGPLTSPRHVGTPSRCCTSLLDASGIDSTP